MLNSHTVYEVLDLVYKYTTLHHCSTYYGYFCCNTRQAPCDKNETYFVNSVILGLSILIISLTLNTGISHSENFQQLLS